MLQYIYSFSFYPYLHIILAIWHQIVPPVIKSFGDQDSRVRYYACEALHNIAKVVRGEFILFFNQIFDALCKLSADSDANVQSAAHLLDRLVKVQPDVVELNDATDAALGLLEEKKGMSIIVEG
ncbi:hypothetical protein QN277_009279 [Acacia crassicarpa]|uniref:Uncharacterized protein n=1 Tax=Acacia crassicarpa TaxID=499986 RepID=A0AAE1IUS1_9FABA|nr:hypothetical protein QN277_009279 [Acacia crassicarpa]